MSERMNMYDHWIALYAACCGVICSVPMALALYRQHENNVLGAGVNPYKNKGNRLLNKLSRILSKLKFIVKPEKVLQRLAREKKNLYEPGETFKFFRSRYSHAMKPDKLHELDNFLKLWGDNKREMAAVLFKTGYPYTTRFWSKVKIFFKLLLF